MLRRDTGCGREARGTGDRQRRLQKAASSPIRPTTPKPSPGCCNPPASSGRLHENLGIRELRQAINEFADIARDADTAVVYYAGHGIEVNGINYLIPVDAVLNRDIDVPYETFSLDNLVQVLEPARRLRLVMLDACRDNPFVRSMKRTIGAARSAAASPQSSRQA